MSQDDLEYTQNQLSALDRGESAANPQAQTLMRSASDPGAVATGQQMQNDSDQAAWRNQQDRQRQEAAAQRDSDRQAKEAQRAQDKADKDAQKQQATQEAAHVKIGQAAGADTDIDPITGHKTIKTDAQGNTVYKPGPVGHPVQAPMLDRAAAAASILGRGDAESGQSGAQSTGGGTVTPQWVQHYRNAKGETKAFPLPTKTDKTTGAKTVTHKNEFGATVTDPAGYDPDIVAAHKEQQAIDMEGVNHAVQAENIKAAKDNFEPAFKPVATEYKASQDDLDSLGGDYQRTSGGGWVRVDDKGKKFPVTASEAATHADRLKSAKERFKAAEAKYNRMLPAKQQIEQADRKNKEKGLQLMARRAALKYGLRYKDLTLARMLADHDNQEAGGAPTDYQNDNNPSVPTQPTRDHQSGLSQAVAEATKEDNPQAAQPTGTPKPTAEQIQKSLLDSVKATSAENTPEGALTFARNALGGLLSAENITIGSRAKDGSTNLEYKGKPIGRVYTEDADKLGAYIKVRPEFANLAGTSGVPVYIEGEPDTFYSPPMCAKLAKEAMAILTAPTVEGDPNDTPAARMAKFKDMHLDYHSLVQLAASGAMPVQFAESMAHNIWNASIKQANEGAPIGEKLQSLLKDRNLFASFTTAASGAWNKGIWRDADGTWNTPVMKVQGEGIINAMQMGQAAMFQKMGGRSSAESETEKTAINDAISDFQRINNLTDEQVKAAWSDASNLVRTWKPDELIRQQSDGSLVVSPIASGVLDRTKLTAAINAAPTSDAIKAQVLGGLDRIAQSVSFNKYSAYRFSDLFREKIDDFAKRKGFTDITGDWNAAQDSKNLVALVKAYEKEVIGNEGKAFTACKILADKLMQGFLEVDTQALGMAAIVSGNKTSAKLASDFASINEAIQTGSPYAGTTGELIKFAPQLGGQLLMTRGVGIVGAAAGLGEAALTRAAFVTNLAVLGSQMGGGEFASAYDKALAEGKSEDEAMSIARRNGAVSAVNAVAFSCLFASLGSGKFNPRMDLALAGIRKSVGEVTVRDLYQVAKAKGVKNLLTSAPMRSFVSDLAKASGGTFGEMTSMSISNAFLNADPDQNLADVWSNAIGSGYFAVVLGGLMHGAKGTFDNGPKGRAEAAKQFMDTYNTAFKDVEGFRPIELHEAMVAHALFYSKDIGGMFAAARAAADVANRARLELQGIEVTINAHDFLADQVDQLNFRVQELDEAIQSLTNEGKIDEAAGLVEERNKAAAEAEAITANFRKIADSYPDAMMRYMEAAKRAGDLDAEFDQHTKAIVAALNEIEALQDPSKAMFYHGLVKLATGNAALISPVEMSYLERAKTSDGKKFYDSIGGQLTISKDGLAALDKFMPKTARVIDRAKSESPANADIDTAVDSYPKATGKESGKESSGNSMSPDLKAKLQAWQGGDRSVKFSPDDIAEMSQEMADVLGIKASEPANKQTTAPTKESKPAPKEEESPYKIVNRTGGVSQILDEDGTVLWSGETSKAEGEREAIIKQASAPLAITQRGIKDFENLYPALKGKINLVDGTLDDESPAMAYMSGRIVLSLAKVEDEIANLSPAAKTARVRAILDEELKHLAQFAWARNFASDLAKTPEKATFFIESWLRDLDGEQLENARKLDRADQLNEAVFHRLYSSLWSEFTPEQQTKIIQTYGKGLESASDAVKAAEGVRMILQLKLGDVKVGGKAGTTESTKTLMDHVSDRVKEIIEAAVDFLRDLVKSGKASKEINEHIAALEGILHEWRAVAGKRAEAESNSVAAKAVGEGATIPAGTKATLLTPNNERKITVTQTVVGLDQLVGSDDPRFPGGALQPRDRSTAASKAQREEMVSNIRNNPDQYRRYIEGSTTDTGRLLVAPLFENGVHATNANGKPLFYVISGNGRRNAIAEAERRGHASMFFDGIYSDLMVGPDVVNPVPVSIYEPESAKDAIGLAELSNRDAQLSVTNTEQSVRDARSVEDSNLLKLWSPDDSGNPAAASNRGFVQAFARAVGDEGILAKDGSLTEEGAKRIERAMFAAILGPDRASLIEQIFNKADALGLRNVIAGIGSEAGNLLRLAIEKPDYDLTPVLADALTLAVEAKTAVANGTAKTPADYFSQGDLFGSNEATPERQLAQAIAGSRSRKAVREILEHYRNSVDAIDTSTMDMFGDVATRGDLVARALDARPFPMILAEVQAEFGQGAALAQKLAKGLDALKKMDPNTRREMAAAVAYEVDRLREGIPSAATYQAGFEPGVLDPRASFFQRWLDSHTPESIDWGRMGDLARESTLGASGEPRDYEGKDDRQENGVKPYAAAYVPEGDTYQTMERLNREIQQNGDYGDVAGSPDQIFHVTLGYGIKPGMEQLAAQALSGMGKITATGKDIIASPHPKKPGESFLMLNLEKSTALDEVRKRLSPYLDRPRTWSPHVTIGLVKTEAASKYVSDSSLNGSKFDFDAISINRGKNSGRPITAYLDPEQDLKNTDESQKAAFYVDVADSNLNTFTPEKAQSAIGRIPSQGKGTQAKATIIVSGLSVESGQTTALLDKLRGAGATVQNVWSGKPDVVRLTRYYETSPNDLNKKHVPAIARQVGEPSVVFTVDAPGNIIQALHDLSGPAWEFRAGDKSRVFTEIPEVMTNHPQSAIVHRKLWEVLSSISDDIRAVGSGVSGLVVSGEEDDLDYMISVDDAEAALQKVKAFRIPGDPTFAIYETEPTIVIDPNTGEKKVKEKVFYDSKTGLKYYKLEVAWDKDGYFDPTPDSAKERMKQCWGKSDIGIVQSDTWGKRMTAHAFIRYMPQSVKDRWIGIKKSFKDKKKSLSAKYPSEDEFKRSAEYKNWKTSYDDQKFRFLQDTERWYGSSAYKDFKDEDTLTLLKNGVQLPSQQLLRNLGTVDEYREWRAMRGMDGPLEIVEPGDPLVRYNTADKVFVKFPSFDGHQDNYIIGDIIDALGFKRGQEIARADYFNGLLGMFRSPENAPEVIVKIIGDIGDGDIVEARKKLQELVPEYASLSALGDSRADALTDVEVDDLLQEVIDMHSDGVVSSSRNGQGNGRNPLLEDPALGTHSGNESQAPRRVGVDASAEQGRNSEGSIRSRPSWRVDHIRPVIGDPNLRRYWQDDNGKGSSLGASPADSDFGDLFGNSGEWKSRAEKTASKAATTKAHANIAKEVAKREGLGDLFADKVASQFSAKPKAKKRAEAPEGTDLLLDFGGGRSDIAPDEQRGTRSPGNRKPNGGATPQSGDTRGLRGLSGQDDDLFAHTSRPGALGEQTRQPGIIGGGGSDGGRGISSDSTSSDSERGATGGSGEANIRGERSGDEAGVAPTDAPVRKLPSLVDVPERIEDRNARIDPSERLSPKSLKDKVAANFTAIELLRRLNEEGRNPTPEEKRTLLAYSGWGAFKSAFDDVKADLYDRISGGYYDEEWQKGEAYFKRAYNDHRTDKEGNEHPSPYDLYMWNKRYGDTHRELKARLSQEEYAAAKRSVLNAHYTTPTIIGAMWSMLEKLGFKGGRILEPGGGTGHFIGTQPEHLAERSQWNAVELDKVTAQILSKLYPQARVNSVAPSPSREVGGQGFQDASIPNNSIDLAISNVPFFEKGPWESKKQYGRSFNLHNYFFARALEKVKPGGLIAFITSSSTMENNADQRAWLARHGDLIAAVRLPNTAFKENAGTEVTTDIIILRKPDGKSVPKQDWQQTRVVGTDTVSLKRGKDQSTTNFLKVFPDGGSWANPSLDEARKTWDSARATEMRVPSSKEKKAERDEATKATKKAWEDYQKAYEKAEKSSGNGKLDADIPIRVNEYFANHPEHAFGKHSLKGSMYRANEYTLAEDESGPSMDERFAKVTSELPSDIFGASGNSVTNKGVKDKESGDMPYSFIERGGKIYQVQKDGLVPVEWTSIQQMVFRSWLRVKNATRALIAGEIAQKTSDAELAELRKDLNRAYDEHVARYDAISRAGASSKHHHLLEDPDYPLTTALEEEVKYLDRKGKSKKRYDKADLFRTRLNKPSEPPTKAESVSDALIASMVWMGYPNGEYMGQLLGRPAGAVVEDALNDGLIFEDPQSGQYIIRDAYLSGHVQRKLDDAKAALSDDPSMARNIAALEKVLPTRKNIAQISVNFGATWIPAEVLKLYAEQGLGLENAEIKYIPESNYWSVFALGNSDDFSTQGIATVDLLKHALSLSTPKLTKSEGTGKEKREVPDPGGTELANQKLQALKADFDRWAKMSDAKLGDKTVQEVLEDAFNEKANGHVPPSFTGEHITLPGASDVVYRSGIRRGAIARMLDQGSGMIAHGVGFGKTYTLIALAMELKRLGKANRPLITVENATLYQFAASFRQAYPNARLLVADEKSFSAENRKRFISRIATGDYDAIVMAHSQYNLIPNHPDVINDYIDKQISELEATRGEVDANDKRAVNALESAKISLENSRRDMLDDLIKRQDVGMYWEDLGVDALLVDEAHRFKNAPVITRMSDMKNIPTGKASQRAIGMTLKTKSVQDKMGGRGVFFATGTPVTNTMAEAYVMMRFTNPDLLEAQGIHNFDNFAAQYGSVVTAIESTWKGKLESVSRFAKFVNGQALINLVRSSWDVQMDPTVAGISRPRVAGGGSELIVLPPGEANTAFNDWVINSIADQWDDPKFWESNYESKRKAFEEHPELSAVPIMTMQAGVAAALDIRLIDPKAEDYAQSKVNSMVASVVKNYHETQEHLGAQAVFCDLRHEFSLTHLVNFAGDPGLSKDGIQETEGKKHQFDLYKDIVEKLVSAGIPRKEIAMVSSEMPKEKRTETFDKVNDGDVRVVIGSSDTMGIGVNMQERLYAIHHMMPPRDFKPAMMEQRNGRILRQGNMYYDLQSEAYVDAVEKALGRKFRKEKFGKPVPDVKAAIAATEDLPEVREAAEKALEKYDIHIYEYGLEKSLDSAIYQTMKAKQLFINQILMGDVGDSFEDPTDEISMGMAEMSARLMGDPLLIRKVELDRDIKKLQLQYDGWLGNVAGARSNLRYASSQLDMLNGQIERLESLADTAKQFNADPSKNTVWEFGGKTIDRNKPEDAEKGWKAPKLIEPLDMWLLEKTKDLRRNDKKQEVVYMEVDGIHFRVELHQTFNEETTGIGEVRIGGKDAGVSRPEQFQGAQSLIQAVSRAVEKAKSAPDAARQEITYLKNKLPSYQKAASEDFAGMDQLLALQAEMAEVNRKLREGPKVAQKVSKALDIPTNYPGAGLAPREMGLSVSPSDSSHSNFTDKDAVMVALEKMPPIYRQVYEAISSGATVDEVRRKFNLSEKAVPNILDQIRSRTQSVLAARSPEGLAPKKTADGLIDGGRPDLALSTIPEVAAIDQIRNASGIPDVRSHDEVNAQAAEWLAKDYAGAYDMVLNKARDLQQMSDLEVAAAKMIISRETLEGRAKTSEQRVKLAMLIHGYRDIGTETARSLAIRRDPHVTPIERHAQIIAEALFSPDDETRARMRKAPKQDQQQILAGWLARVDAIKAELRDRGIDIDATLAEFNSRKAEQKAQEDLAPKTTAVIEQQVARLNPAHRAMIEAVRSGALLSRAALLSGMSVDEARGVYGKFILSVDKTMEEAARKYLAGALGASSNPMSEIRARLGLPDLDMIDDTVTGFVDRRNEKPRAPRKPSAPKADKAPAKKPGGANIEVRGPDISMAEWQRRPLSTWRTMWQSEMAKLRPEQRISFEEWSNLPLNKDKAGYQRELGLEKISDTQGTFDLTDPIKMREVVNAFSMARGSKMDKVMEFWKTSLLSGPQTMFRIATSHAASAVWDLVPRRMAEATINNILGLFGAGSDKAATFGEFKAMMKYVDRAAKLAARIGMQSWQLESSGNFDKYALAQAQSFEFSGVYADKIPPALGGKLGKIMRSISFRNITAAEQFIKGFYGQLDAVAQAHRMATAEGLTGDAYDRRMEELLQPGSEAWVRALDNTKYVSFQTKSVFDGMAFGEMKGKAGESSVLTVLDAIYEAVKEGKKLPFIGIPLQFALPFTLTPLNISKMFIEMTPFLSSTISLFDAARSLRRRVFRGDLTPMEAKAAADALYDRTRLVKDLANQVIGWMMYYAFRSFADSDDKTGLPIMTGSMSIKESRRGERNNAYAVMPPKTVRFGNVMLNYEGLEPFSFVATAVIDLENSITKNGGLNEAALSDYLGKIPDEIKGKTMLQGLSDVIAAWEEPDRFLANWAGNIATGFTPNLIRTPIREMDPYVRDSKARADDGFFTHLAKKVGYSLVPTAAPAKIDVWGNPIKKNRGAEIGGSEIADKIIRTLTPLNPQVDVQPDPIDLYIYNHNLRTGDLSDKISILPIEDHVTRKGVKISLTPAEHEEANRNAGQSARAELGDDWDWRNPTDEGAQRIREAFRRAQKFERDRIKAEKGTD